MGDEAEVFVGFEHVERGFVFGMHSERLGDVRGESGVGGRAWGRTFVILMAV